MAFMRRAPPCCLKSIKVAQDAQSHEGSTTGRK
jgi:hypothetical protein